MTLAALLDNPNALPTAPRVTAQLIGSFDNEAVAVDEIVRLLSADPVLGAKLLRLANSAYYRVSRTIGTLDGAVRMAGFAAVRTLAVSSGLVNGFRGVPGIDLRRFWRYSLNTAVAARWIARQSGEDPDLAFTIGIMHAIGQLVIHGGIAQQAQELAETAGPFSAGRVEAEQAALGYSHADVGAELALRWKFPPLFAAAIKAYPAPLVQAPFDRMAALVHLAAWRARAEESGPGGEAAATSFPAAVAHRLGLSPDLLLRQMPPLAELSAGLDELVQ